MKGIQMFEQIDDSKLLNILNAGQKDIESYTFKNYLEKAKMKSDMKKMFGSYFQTGELCFLAGKTGVGKSILAYQIADGLSKGLSILGQPNETEPQRVLYYDFELNERNIKLRFTDYEPNDNFLRPDITDILIENDGQFNFDIIANDIEITNANVVIIDNISAIALKSTQDQDTAMNIMKSAKLLQREKDISLLIIAHTPKLKETRPLELYDIAGSSHLHNFIDNAVMIGKSATEMNIRYLKQVKNRNDIENDKVLKIEIVNNDWLQFENRGYDNETNHLILNPDKEEKRKTKLIDIAENLIGNSEISYTDFCYKYAEQYQKTIENGKKIIGQLVSSNLIIKNADGKYIINQNEISE